MICEFVTLSVESCDQLRGEETTQQFLRSPNKPENGRLDDGIL